ncbi:uncharacterized protein MYCGRDRAFT_96583 [Zymoseptoria tritici IPO323]|uniref:Uncharacterized protein n=3 Tax=Zymoseptoria tritici TaxID=1047171 RepID=F9XMV3_ZYMTI|nr:uncharacterized protein MYCGRDRAFT_96583 [Zymoseptoria tritici IPO323]EGP83306.1 hypothetical protein MYCGRDRAFT_96583 [Zymoseptoria tritici IPO323]
MEKISLIQPHALPGLKMDVTSLMTGNLEQDAATLDRILEGMCEVLEAQPELEKKLKHRVCRPGGLDEARIRKLCRFSGPDDWTRQLLASNAISWRDGMRSFWDDANGQDTFIDPQAYAISVFYRLGAAPSDDA